MGKNKNRKKQKRQKQKKQAKAPTAPKKAAPAPQTEGAPEAPSFRDEPAPSGPNLDAGPYVGSGERPPERKAWHILVLVALGAAGVLGLAGYNQFIRHTENTLEDRLFDERKAETEARKQHPADGSPVRSDSR